MVLTAYVVDLRSQPVFDHPAWAAARRALGTRYEVFLRPPDAMRWTHEVYTTDELRASACLEAKRHQRPVTLTTRTTRYGEEIVSLSLENPEDVEVPS